MADLPVILRNKTVVKMGFRHLNDRVVLGLQGGEYLVGFRIIKLILKDSVVFILNKVFHGKSIASWLVDVNNGYHKK